MTATTIIETPDYFYSSVLPVVQNSFALDHKWADGVLYRDESPQDVIYGDLDQKTGFVLFIHQKWNERDFRELNLIAIAYRHDVHSLRDLVPDHVDWLQSMRNQVVNILPEIYGIKMKSMQPVLYVPYPWQVPFPFSDPRKVFPDLAGRAPKWPGSTAGPCH